MPVAPHDTNGDGVADPYEFGGEFDVEQTVGGQPLSEDNRSPVGLGADLRTGKLSSGFWTLASTVTPETINVPNTARGVVIRPTASDIRFAVGEAPVALGGESLVVGATAFGGEPTVRLFEATTGRVLQLLATVASSTCYVEFF